MRLFLAIAAAALGGALLPASAPAAERGVIHAVIGPQRVLPAAGLPDIPPSGSTQEVWFNRDGTGWRSRQALPGEGYVEQVADARGSRMFDSRTGEVLTLRRGDRRLDDDYLEDPWLGPSGVILDPLGAVRRGRARIVGETAIDGEPAYELQRLDLESGFDSLRVYAAKDDGALLRGAWPWRQRIYDSSDPETDDRKRLEKLKDAPLRTVVVDVPTYDVLAATVTNLKRLKMKAPRRKRQR